MRKHIVIKLILTPGDHMYSVSSENLSSVCIFRLLNGLFMNRLIYLVAGPLALLPSTVNIIVFFSELVLLIICKKLKNFE